MYLTQHTQNAAAAQRMRALIRKRGVNPQGFPLWTPDEDDLCRRLYPDYAALRAALPERTAQAIQKRCATLGVQRRLYRWTAKDLSDLRRMYGVADWPTLNARFPSVSSATLTAIANNRGWTRPRKPYLSTGDYLFDELRSRAFRERLTMRHLEEYVGRGSYFRNKCWRRTRGGLCYDKIVRAIHELGGKLSVTWDDEQ